MMKIKYINIVIVLVTMMTSCNDTGIDVILPSSFDYITFEDTSISVNEADSGTVSVNFFYSTGNFPTQDLTFQYDISFPSDLLAAQEGIDYNLPSGSGSFVLPAGQGSVMVPLLEIIDNDISAGGRHISFALQPVDGLLNGPPDNRGATTTITINEDDLFEFGFTSFEEVTTFDTLTTYPRPAGSVDPLPNIQDSDPTSDAPYVSFVATGNELGFTASFSAASVDAIENERIGVYNNTVAAANPSEFETTFIDGDQAYVTSDLDGTLTLVFDEITGLNPNVSNAVLDITLFFLTTSWETEDGIKVFFETADGLGEPLLSIFDDDVEEIEGTWQELRVPIPQDRLADGRLIITMRNGAGAETIIIDSVSIKGIL